MEVPLLRSADMKYVSITMTNEVSPATMREIGKSGTLHLVDLSSLDKGQQPSRSHLHYKKRIQDITTLERRLILLNQYFDQNYRDKTDYPIEDLHASHGDVIDSCRTVMVPLEEELQTNIAFQKENLAAISSLMERRAVMEALRKGKLDSTLHRIQTSSVVARSDRQLRPHESASHIGLLEEDVEGYTDDEDDWVDEIKSADDVDAGSDQTLFRTVVTGTIPVDQQMSFSRMVYRITRGNAFLAFVPLSRPSMDVETGIEVQKVVFSIQLIGRETIQRVKRLCETLHAPIFALPSDAATFTREVQRIKADLKDKRSVDKKTSERIQSILQRIGDDEGTSPVRNWLYALSVEKNICNAFLQAHFYLTMISIEGWVVVKEIPKLRNALQSAVLGSGFPPAAMEIDPSNPIRLPDRPPSFFELNKFTGTFQAIVDTYGVPRYKEINPGLFTIISFPFLFGVMYGDIGHGICLTLFSMYLVYAEKKYLALEKRKQLNEIFSMAFSGRYMLLLMGIFAVFCGTVYNDCFSIPLNIYGSTFTPNGEVNGVVTYNHTGGTYPYGVDPVWAHKTNELAFYNSMKMKMAVIIGVVHMLFGITLSLFNHLYFNDKLSIYLEFIPRLIFMCSTFGYMCWMILYKWCQDWTTRSNPAPNLIQTMISMFLNIGSVEEQKILYLGQAGLQTFFVIIAVLSVPVMLFGKPYAHKRLHDAKHRAYQFAGSQARDDSLELHLSDDDMENNEKEDFLASDEIESEDLQVSLAKAHEPTEGHDMRPGQGLTTVGDDLDSHAFNFNDELIHNAIHTIEFVLGCVSNTASYLRLWALSLAHAQLSKVFWEKMIQQYGIENGAFFAFVGFSVWVGATTAVLLAMDVLECFLHALRLHWVEFQNKFFYADGYQFTPFAFEKMDEFYF